MASIYVANSAWLLDARAPSRTPARPHQETVSASPKLAAVRRLPPTPGGSSSTSSPTNPFAMPEPEPYHEAGAPRHGHYSGDSYASSTASNDLLRKATAGSASGRRLPPAPATMNGARPSSNGGRPFIPGLPADPRPPVRVLSHASYESNSSSSTGGSYSSPVSRESSYRPPGALPPSVPGRYDSEALPSLGFDNQSISSDWSYQKPVNIHQYNPSVSRSSSALGIPAGLPRKPSREYLASPVLPALSFTASGDVSQRLCMS